jgi:2-iminobutanoate/2-iminopropanoate deaminase
MDHTTGKLVDGDIAAQTRQVFANLRAVLKASDLTFDDVVKVTVYMTDLSEFEAMNKVYQEHFKEPYPARTTIGVAQLPRGSKIEIEMIAEGGPLAA